MEHLYASWYISLNEKSNLPFHVLTRTKIIFRVWRSISFQVFDWLNPHMSLTLLLYHTCFALLCQTRLWNPSIIQSTKSFFCSVQRKGEINSSIYVSYTSLQAYFGGEENIKYLPKCQIFVLEYEYLFVTTYKFYIYIHTQKDCRFTRYIDTLSIPW